MNALLAPETLTELAAAVRSLPQLLAVGAGTKPRLSAVNVAKLSTTKLRGILEYDPTEFTFTALAGTPVREIAAALAERGQYLPFDPLLMDAGTTLGGTVAAGLSGPGRFRFGGVRDFILGVRFVDGGGRLLRMGGKVVKNAAGFDLPKFFVGSLGRFGVLGEITFKVFPRPPSTLTLVLRAAASLESLAKTVVQAARARWELDALDVPPGGRVILMRLAGSEPALTLLARDILATYPGTELADAESFWSGLREFRWAHPAGVLIKVPLSPADIVPLFNTLHALDDARLHLSVGGNVAYISLPQTSQAVGLGAMLELLGLGGMMLRGATSLWLGRRTRPAIEGAVKRALDPGNRFPSLDD